MAMIDSSIYFQQKTADPFGSYAEGRKMGDMIRQQQKQKGVEQAYKAGMVKNPDGTYKQDLGVTMSELAKGGHAQEYSSLAQQQKEQQAAQSEAAWKSSQRTGELINSTLHGIKSAKTPEEKQGAYTFGLNQAKKYGIDISGYPEILTPEVESKLSYAANFSTDSKFKQDQSNKDREFSLKEKELALKDREEKGKLAKGGKVGQDALDRDFAKDYNDWTSGGAKSARSEINKLSGVISDLKSKKVTTGGLTGMFPDQITSDKVLSARANVQSTVMNSLRAILGAQFTEKEGERIIKNTWNEADSTENNVARLERLVGDLTNQAADKDEKSRYYEQGGTLTGYKGMGIPNKGSGQSIAQTKPQVLKTNQIEWAD